MSDSYTWEKINDMRISAAYEHLYYINSVFSMLEVFNPHCALIFDSDDPARCHPYHLFKALGSL